MGGPRANHILFDEWETLVITSKYGGAVVPHTLVRGLDSHIHWFDQARRTGINKPYDAIDTHGATLLNVPEKTLIAGFGIWYDDLHPEVFDAVPLAYLRFHRHRNLRRVFTELIQPLWPDHGILFAEVDSFAVEEAVEPDPAKVEWINPGPETDVPASDADIRRTFRRLLDAVMRGSADEGALRRLPF